MIWEGWSNLGAFGKSEQNQRKPNQITYRQPSPKVCVHLFHCQDEDQFWIFVLFQFNLGWGRCQEGFWEVQILGFLRSKSSNLKVIENMGYECGNVSMSQKLQIFCETGIWWNVINCMRVWEVAFNFWLSTIVKNFTGGVKSWVEKSFLKETLKMDIGKYVDIDVNQYQKVLFCQFHSI